MRRAIVAVLLTIGFYSLALAIAALLLFIVYAQFWFFESIHPGLTLACIVTAGLILWSILPRIDRFTPPGPRMTPENSPDLFRQVNDIANRVKQKLPDEVYLIAEVNAFVVERGGLMGIGSRRIMGIGLPLLQTLTIPQFRAVIAHEFGHFYGGDTKLAPLVYNTRQTIIRTIKGLGERSWLQILFRLYGMMFLRITQTIARHQELVADGLAMQIVGTRPFVESLRTIHGVAPAFKAFLQNEVAPAVQAGYRPALTEGFSLFLCDSAVDEMIRQSLGQEMEISQTDPLDTHPSLKERIAAAEAFPPGADAGDQTPALSLVQNVPDLEQRLFVQMLGTERAAALKPMNWQSAATQVWLPMWDKVVHDYAAGLEGVTAASLPGLLQSPGKLGVQIDCSAGRFMRDSEKRDRAANITAAALVVALARGGWVLDTSPGAQVSLRQGENRIEPFVAVPKLASDELSAKAWQVYCQQIGIADLRLDGESC
jgi:Zn-dependent protease with chaperone function